MTTKKHDGGFFVAKNTRRRQARPKGRSERDAAATGDARGEAGVVRQHGADAHQDGIVLGTQVPIVLTSRTDGKLERIASCAIGALLARAKATGGIK